MRSLIILTALSFAAPLSAAPMEPVTAKVMISDLNLASASGRHALHRRIAAAVEQVCGSYANAREQYEQMIVERCRADAMASASQQIASKSSIVHVASSDAR